MAKARRKVKRISGKQAQTLQLNRLGYRCTFGTVCRKCGSHNVWKEYDEPHEQWCVACGERGASILQKRADWLKENAPEEFVAAQRRKEASVKIFRNCRVVNGRVVGGDLEESRNLGRVYGTGS